MGPVWRVEMLGGLRASSHGREVSRFRTRRVAVLLAYLALHRGRLYPREEIAEMLWPDTDEEASRRNLRQALHSLRKVLEPPSLPAGSVLQVKHSLLGLNPETVTTDVGEMEALVDVAREAGPGEKRLAALKQALGLYRGDLLPGVDELWTMNERFRMEDLYLGCLRGVIEECEALGRLDEAVHYLRLAISKEPLNQEWHLALMRDYLELNRPGSALKQFQEFEEVMAKELGGEPDDEVRALAETARAAIGGEREAAVLAGEAVFRERPVEEGAALPVAEARLPVQMTRLFGREGEIQAVQRLFLDGARLVTILGSAGTGKTRLSVEAARGLGDEEWDVWFVPLADIDDAALIFERVLDTLRPRGDRKNPLGQIRAVVKGKRTLLVLDNFEHIVEEGAGAVMELLATVPEVSCLVTSRQSLNIEGERLFPLLPLAIPDWEEGAKVETRDQLAELAAYPSVQLLVDRFQAIRPDVQITLQNARHFVKICQKLEGIPLALEIAAGLSKTSTPGQIVKQLENRLLVLTSRRRDITPRHRSLRAAIDYGFQALTPKLQRFFASLSVFRGGFSLEAACAVCYELLSDETGRAVRDQCLNALLDLQERSFLRAEESGPDEAGLRFRMLETFREYGEEQLSEEEIQKLEGRHAEFYLSLCLSDEEMKNPAARAELALLIEVDFHNYLAAIETFYERRKVGALIRLLTGLTTAWDVRGTKSAEEAMIRKTVHLPESRGLSAKDRVQLLRMLATTYLRKSEFQAAYEACRLALDVALESGEDGLIAACYFGMSLCAGHLGQTEQCIELCQKVLEHAPETDTVLLERTYVSIGSAHWSRDELEEAEKAFGEARRVSEAARGGEADPLILAHLAGLAIDRGRLDEGMALANDGLRVSRSRGNAIALVSSLVEVARYHRKKGNLVAALATNREALMQVRDLGIAAQCYQVIWEHAMVLAASGVWEAAVSLIAASRGIASLEKDLERRETEGVLGRARQGLTEERYEASWARGLAMDMDEAFRTAIYGAGE